MNVYSFSIYLFIHLIIEKSLIVITEYFGFFSRQECTEENYFKFLLFVNVMCLLQGATWTLNLSVFLSNLLT